MAPEEAIQADMRRRILVVDDSAPVAEQICGMLQRVGMFPVAVVPSGAEAIQAADSLHPDLVLMDIRLQGDMDGIDAAATIQKRRRIPVIYLTMHADEFTLAHAQVTQPYGYLIKPVDPTSLKVAIEVAVERHRLETALRESEDRYRRLFEMESDALVLVRNCDGRILEVNAAACAMYGYSREEWLKLRHGDVSHEPEQPADATRNGHGHAMRQCHRKKDGALFPVEIMTTHFTWQGQDVHLAAIRDVTERDAAEDERRRNVEHVREMAELLPEIVFEMDRDGLLTFINQQALAITGYDMTDFQHGFRALDILAPEDRLRAWACLQTLLSGEPLTKSEYTAVRKSGERFPVTTRSVPIVRDGKAVGVRGIIFDMTESRKTEARLRATEKLAAQGRMAALIAHEINNPLAGIKHAFQLIKGSFPQDHRHARYVGMIEREIDRVAALVVQMFDLYGKGRKEPNEFLPAEAIQQSADILAPRFRQRDVTLQIDCSEAQGHVRLPESAFRQIMLNLMDNALDASPEGRVVSVKARLQNHTLQVTVADEGAGIPPELHDRIFEPFFTTKGCGTTAAMGLGLSITRNLLSEIGGEIGFQSERELGTRFWIHLPLES